MGHATYDFRQRARVRARRRTPSDDVAASVPVATSPSDPFQRSVSVANHPAIDEGNHMSTREDS